MLDLTQLLTAHPFPTALDPFTCNRYEIADFGRAAHALGINYLGVCCGGAPHHIRSLAEALGRLMNECLALRQRLDQTNVRQLVRWIAGVECYELSFSSLETATQLVAEATGSG